MGAGARYFLNISFRGAPFHGWQRQPGDISVQQVVEEALATVLKVPHVAVTGAGRTDAGVNARVMPAHFDAEAEIADLERFRGSLNALVGNDIAINEVYRVPDGMHARFDAVERTYRYFAVPGKSVFAYPLAWRAPLTLDYDAMNEAAALLTEVSDFTSFAKLHSDAKTNICDVRHAQWHPFTNALGGEQGWYFEISADRFLRNMVRAVVGTLVEVGRGKMSLEGFRRVIEMCDRCCAGTSMPAHALFLWDVKYPAF